MDVLVAVDDEALCDVLLMALDLMDYDVAHAPDGATTLARLRGARQNAVVALDSSLPDMGGLELLELIASDPWLAYGHAYLLMIDRRTTLPEHAHAVLAALGVPVLVKPFDLDTLFEAVAQLAARLRSRPMAAANCRFAPATLRPRRVPPCLERFEQRLRRRPRRDHRRAQGSALRARPRRADRPL